MINNERQTKKWLHDQYWIRERSLKQIADMCEVCLETVRRWMKKQGISRRTPNEANPSRGKTYEDVVGEKRGKEWRRKQGEAKLREKNPQWKGGRYTRHGCGYVYVQQKSHPRAWKHGGYVPEHVLVAEKALGRHLKKGEIVHHINMDKGDNRNCNLLICDTAYHSWLHTQYEKAFAKRLDNRLCPQYRRSQ